MDYHLKNIAELLSLNPIDNINIILRETNKSIGNSITIYHDSGTDKSLFHSDITFEGYSNIKQAIEELSIGFSKSINKRSVSGKSLISNDIIKDYTFLKKQSLDSYIIVPVTINNDDIGFIATLFSTNGKFETTLKDSLEKSALLISYEVRDLFTKDQLAKLDTKFNTVYDNSVDCIFLLDKKRIVDVNNSACRLFGFEKSDLLNESIIKLVAEVYNDNIEFSNEFESIFDTVLDEDKLNFEWKLIRSDKTDFIGEVTIVSIINNDEYNTLVNIRDISKRKKYEKDLIAAKEKANESSRLKSMSLASMSHELRTPLNSIIGFSDLLLDEDTTEDEKEMFSKLIQTAGNSLMQLIGDIVDISKIEAGQVTIQKTLFNINSFLQEIMFTFKQAKENQNKSDIELRMVLSDKASDLEIETDPHRLQQIFNNLLTNSLKFIDEGFIEFGYLSITPDYIQFYVKDTGVGIDNAKKDKIFEHFGQDETTYSRNRDGTGLGLAISKSFVELLGGNIWLDSEPNAGSTFYFTIPINSNLDLFGNGFNNYIGTNWKDKTILIADDVKENFVFLKGLLGHTGVKIIWAKNGQQAVDKCKNKNIDIVLMDIRMPVMDGLEATLLIKQENPNIYIIAQTAFASPEDEVNCKENGCDEYFKKPINHNRLFAVIKKYFN